MMYPRLKLLIEEQLPVTVYGYLPFMEDCVLESRPLGLIPANELSQIQAKLQRLAKQAEDTIDIDGCLHWQIPQMKSQILPSVVPLRQQAKHLLI